MPILIIGGIAIVALAIGLLVMPVFVGQSGTKTILHALFGGIPFIGGWIDNQIEHAFTWATSAISVWADNSLGPAAEFFWGHAVGLWGAMNQAATFASSVVGSITRARDFTSQWAASLVAYMNTGVAQAEAVSAADLSVAKAYADQWGASLVNYANTGIADVEAVAAADFVAAKAYTDQWAASLIAYANTGVAQVESDITALGQTVNAALAGGLASVTGQLNGLVGTVEADAAAAARAIAAATSTATQAGAAAAGVAINAGAADVFNPAWEAIVGALQPIVTAIPTTAAEALGLPATLEGTSAATIPAILALTIPALGAVATEVGDCLLGNCDALGEIGSLFNALESTAFVAAILALLAEAASNPGQAASDVESVLGGAVNGAESAFRDLIGV